MITKLFFAIIDVVYKKKQNPKDMIKKLTNSVTLLKNVKYHKSKNALLDMYIPKKECTNYPVHIYIHGGGFTAGNKKYRKALGYFLADGSDNIVLNVEYTKSPKFTFDESTKQLLNVFEFIYANADVYHFDLSKVSIGGDSSGAFFSLYLSLITTNKELAKYYEYSPKFKIYKTMVNCGVFDYKTAEFDPRLTKYYYGILKNITHLKFEEIEKSKYEAFAIPLKFVDENTSPMLLCYSKFDMFCKGQSEELITYLLKYKVPFASSFATQERYNHCYSLGWRSRKSMEFNNLYKDFLKGDFLL